MAIGNGTYRGPYGNSAPNPTSNERNRDGSRWLGGRALVAAGVVLAGVGLLAAEGRVAASVVDFYNDLSTKIGSSTEGLNPNSAELPAVSVDLDANRAEVRSQN